MNSLTELSEWQNLATYSSIIKLETRQARHSFTDYTKNIVVDNIILNYQDQFVDEVAIEHLLALARACNVPDALRDLMHGSIVNNSEQKPALHTALRSFDATPLYVNGQDIMPQVFSAREQMRLLSNQIRNKQWLGFTDKPITDVVNLGIGGSHLGPQCTLQALSEYSTTDLSFHFISNSDPHELRRLTSKLCPETTLFIVSSKSFNTQETLAHANAAMRWLNQPQYTDRHFIAVTANVQKAQQLGFSHIIPIWDWVGGRFSVCSAINLITCIAIGYEAFCEFLQGAHAMDQHTLSADLKHNLPVMLALLGIWNNNFLNIHQLLLLTYAQDLQYFPAYIQQLDMESNGKSVDKQGLMVQYATGPIVWGSVGNQAQHSYYQLLCQGTHQICADLISIDTYHQDPVYHMCLAHKEILAHGEDGYRKKAALNTIRLADCSPRAIGALIAAYEHKVYIQGVIWGINSFDQPGVEGAKKFMTQSIQRQVALEI